MNRLKRRCAAALCCGALAQAGCSSMAPDGNNLDETEHVGTTQQRATAYEKGTWTPWTSPVKVCFKSELIPGDTDPNAAVATNTAGHPDFDTLRDSAYSALVSTWGAIPGVVFQKLTSCPTSGEFLTLNLLLSNGWGGACGRGAPRTECFLKTPLADASGYQYYGTAVHEVGHALGLIHEHQRTDASLCTWLQLELDSCRNVVLGADAFGVVSAADYNGCRARVPATTPTVAVAPGSDDYNWAKYWIGQDGPAPSTALTRYDPVSAMNYCEEANGRDEYSWEPSFLDYLGIEVLYSKAARKVGCKGGCFKTGGDTIVMHSAASLVTDWTALGAVNLVPFWYVGQSVLHSQSLSAADITTGSIAFAFQDPFDGSHSGSANVVKSNGRFAAILVNAAL